MADKIRVLDEVTINQIAAGEVIENASSVVKELVDNCLDAGASKIVVEVQGSGRQSIVVQDNGSGMSLEDLMLCIERHATSKIRSEEDLWSVTTMGFRGEALSAISSVSHLSILTAEPSGSPLSPGFHLLTSGGKITSCTPVQTLVGTKICVDDLFYNVPARRKFLKSPVQEAKEILKVMTLHALARPDVSFELICNGIKELHLSREPLSSRIRALLGPQLFSELVPISFRDDQVVIEGYVGKPTATRPTRALQYLFINNRPVTSHFVSSCVKEAYGSSIDSARHPAFVLFVTLCSSRVDVNVHPQKKEVRFSEEEALRLSFLKGVSGVLFCRKEAVQAVTPVDLPVRSFQMSSTQVLPEIRPQAAVVQELPVTASNRHIVGIYDEFILATGLSDPLEGLSFVHSRYALSRILFEEWRDEKKEIASQSLVVPVYIECTPEETKQVKMLFPVLQRAGIAIAEFGATGFLIEAIPPFLERIDLKELLLTAASTFDPESAFEKQREVLFQRAYRLQKKIDYLSIDMAKSILDRLLLCKEPYLCPFGNKTVFVLSDEELKSYL